MGAGAEGSGRVHDAPGQPDDAFQGDRSHPARKAQDLSCNDQARSGTAQGARPDHLSAASGNN